METIDSHSDPTQASASLDAVADARRAVRDRPWPLWLYPTNALLLGALALTGLLDASWFAALVVIAVGCALPAINYRVGRAMGTPFAIPTSVGFRLLVVLAGAFVIASVVTRGIGSEGLTVACAAGATLSYTIGSVIHYRSTRR